jgi:hypothetical protein
MQPPIHLSRFDELFEFLKNIPPRAFPPQGTEGKVWLNSFSSVLAHPRLSVYLDSPPTRAKAILAQEFAENSPTSSLARQVNTDVRVYELAEAFAAGGADEHAALHALCYGMMTVETGIDTLLLAGEGVLDPKIFSLVIASRRSDLLSLLLRYRSPAVFACLGAMIAAGFAKIPVLAASGVAHLAAWALWRLRPEAPGHIALIGHSVETWPGIHANITDESLAGCVLMATRSWQEHA